MGVIDILEEQGNLQTGGPESPPGTAQAGNNQQQGAGTTLVAVELGSLGNLSRDDIEFWVNVAQLVVLVYIAMNL